MYTVKLTFNYDLPIMRQTPRSSGVWGKYHFIIDDNLKEAAFWIIYTDHKLKKETVYCNPKNTIFIPAESKATSPKFDQKFLDQFGKIVTVQRGLKHKNIMYSHNANPWYVDKTFDELKKLHIPKKTKLISVICSNITTTKGHRDRLKFVNELKKHFGSKLDVFGRGVRDFDDKWEVLKDYKYSIVLENDFKKDWVTEKIFDCFLAGTFPIYYGCPNLEKYVPKKYFQRISIHNVKESIKTIEKLVNSDIFSTRMKDAEERKKLALMETNFFPWIANILDQMDPTLEKIPFKFTPNRFTQPLTIFQRINRKAKKILWQKKS